MHRAAAAMLFSLSLSAVAGGQIGGGGGAPGYDFDWVTIGAVGNAPYGGPDPTGYIAGRGSVGYAYRISRLEVTTAQWMEFVNAYAGTGGPRPQFAEYIPGFWGAAPDPSYQGPGERWRLDPSLPQAGMLPVAGISWRDAAMYCNWLHNGKSSALSALTTGAYDTSTWGLRPGGGVTDACDHLPEAQFWIPTLDEWLKAAHFDPHRYGPNAGGYWMYPNGSDAAPVPGPPGVGASSAGWADPAVFNGEWLIPLGAYPGTQSPSGLLDVSGGASEWIEDFISPENHSFRYHDGAPAGPPVYWFLDEINSLSVAFPQQAPAELGIRLASAVPGPATPMVGVLLFAFFPRRERSCRSKVSDVA